MSNSVEISKSLHEPLSKVWRALTEKEQVKQYFWGTNLTTDWKVGSPILFTGEWEGKPYTDKGIVLEFEKEKKLSYSYWSSFSGLEDTPENYLAVTYSLSFKDGITILVISQKNFKSEEAKEHTTQGWKAVLDALEEYLKKN